MIKFKPFTESEFRAKYSASHEIEADLRARGLIIPDPVSPLLQAARDHCRNDDLGRSSDQLALITLGAEMAINVITTFAMEGASYSSIHFEARAQYLRAIIRRELGLGEPA